MAIVLGVPNFRIFTVFVMPLIRKLPLTLCAKSGPLEAQ